MTGTQGARFVVLIVGCLLIGNPELHGETQFEFDEISNRNEDSFLTHLSSALPNRNETVRVYYATDHCPKPDNYPVFFPHLRIKSHSEKGSGPAAIREMFAADKKVSVTEAAQSQVIRINVRKVPQAILATRIHLLRLDPTEQYNAPLAIQEILKTGEVRANMDRLRLRQPFLATLFNMFLVTPAPGLPHFPSEMTNLTVDEALDLIAKTFDAVVLYGVCARAGVFSIEFIPRDVMAKAKK